MKKVLSLLLSVAMILSILSGMTVPVSAATVMTSSEFVQRLVDVAENYKTLYVMGSFGSPLTEARKSYFINTHHCDYNNDPERAAMINAASADTFGFDCVCLIKGILWGWNGDTTKTNGGAVYTSNNVPDIGANDIINVCSNVSTVFNHNTMLPGELVWMSGHVGIYIGNGLVVECSPKWENGVQITACNKTISGYNRRDWTKHGKLPYINYDDSQVNQTADTEAILSEIASTYAAIRITRGATYQGWCGKFVADQLNYMGIGYIKVSSSSSLNGNKWYSSLATDAITTHGYKQVKYSGNNCLNNIVSAKGSVVYNVVISFNHQYGYSDSNPGAGHVVLIHAIVDGYVYFCECYSSGSRAEGQPQKRTISAFMSAYNKSYGSAIGAIHFDGNYSVSPSPISNNPDDYPEPTRNIGYYNNVPTTGDDVKWVQAVLSQLGYSITIDGSFGPASKAVVIDFQKENSLDQDGSVGEITRAKLKEKWAQFKNRNSYSFNFNPNGGNMGSDFAFNVEFGQDFYVENTTCTKYGYYFGGWNVKRNNDNTWYVAGVGWCSESTISSKNYTKKNYPNYTTLTLDDSWINGLSGDGSFTFYATWLPEKYTITYNANGGTGAPAAQSYTYAEIGTTTLSSTVPTRSGYTFLGWSLSSTATTASYTAGHAWGLKNASNYTLYAVWAVNAVRVAIRPAGGTWNGSTDAVDTQYAPGTKINLGTPTRTGYKFVCWDIDYSGSGHILEPWGVPLHSDPIFAHSLSNINLYNNANNDKVTIEKVGRESDSPTNGAYNLKITTTGKADPGLGGYYQITSSKASGVFYHMIVAKIPVGYKIERYANSCGMGATHEWLTSQDGTGKFETYIYKTTCGSSGTFGSLGHVALVGEAATESNPVTWYVAYSEVFDGTGISSNGTSYTVGNGTGILQALWKGNTYTITYDANGGTGAPVSQSYTYAPTGATTLSSTKPTRTGYSFLGWSLDKTATSATYSAGQSWGLMNASNYTLYAVWKTDNFTIAYDANGGANAPADQIKIYGSDLILSTEVPTKSYTIIYNANGGNVTPSGKDVICTFKNWDTNVNGSGTVYASGATYSSNTGATLYAQWINPTAGELVTPTREGYTFVGWFTSENGGTQITSDSTITDNIVVYAHWEEIPVITLSSIAVNSLPTKTVYEIGETLDTTGLTLKLTYSDSSTEIVSSGFATSGFDSATAGTITVTVLYGERTATFNVTVVDNSATAPKYEINDVTGAAGNTVEMFITVANNPGIVSLRNTVSFDSTVLELINVEDTGLLKGYTAPSSNLTSPYTLRWADSLATANNSENGNIVKLTFRIKDSAEAGVYDITVNPVEARNVDGTKITFVSAKATVTVVDYIIGDTDGDGEVSDWDAIILNRYLAGWNVDIDALAADIDGDGEVSDWDAIILERYLAGWNVELG